MRPKNRPRSRNAPTFIENARRAQIIDAAVEVVAEFGYTGASFVEIARHARITKSIISYHFEDKNDLLDQLVRRIYDEIWAFVEPRLKEQTTAAGRIRTYIESEFAYIEGHRSQLLALGNVLLNHRDAKGRLRLKEEAQTTVVGLLSGIFEAGQKAGEFRSFSPTVMAVAVHHAINGALDRWAQDASIPLADYARELATVFDLATRRDSVSAAQKAALQRKAPAAARGGVSP